MMDLRVAARRLLEEAPEIVGLPSWVQPDLGRHWRRVLARSRALQEAIPERGPRVLIITTLARDAKWPARIAILSQALRVRGAQPVIAACDRWLDACGEVIMPNFTMEQFAREGPRSFCDACFGSADAVYRELATPYRRLREFEPPGSRASAERLVASHSIDNLYQLTYRGLVLGPTIESAVLGFMLRGSRPSVGEPWVDQVVRRFALACVMMVDAVWLAIDELQPDKLVVPIDVYVEEVPRLVGNARGIDVVSVGLWDSDRWLVGLGAPTQKELARRAAGPWDTIDLTPERMSRLDTWLRERFEGRMRYTYRNEIAEERRVREIVGLDPTRPLVVSFLPTAWETVTYSDADYARNDAIFDTIRVVAARPELQLVLRVHPRERSSLTRETFESIIRHQFPTLPRNVHLVPASQEVNSYVLGQMSAAIVVHGGTMGLEMACEGKAVICTGAAAYRGKGFTFDAGSPGEIGAFLDRLEEFRHRDEDRVRAARRFAYYLLFMRELPIPLWYRPGMRERGARAWWRALRSLEDLLPGRHEGLDLACEAVISGREPYRMSA